MKVVRKIAYGYRYKRGVSDGKKYTEGFMYGDALISAAIIMFYVTYCIICVLDGDDNDI